MQDFLFALALITLFFCFLPTIIGLYVVAKKVDSNNPQAIIRISAAYSVFMLAGMLLSYSVKWWASITPTQAILIMISIVYFIFILCNIIGTIKGFLEWNKLLPRYEQLTERRSE